MRKSGKHRYEKVHLRLFTSIELIGQIGDGMFFR